MKSRNNVESVQCAPMTKEYAAEVSNACKGVVRMPPEWFKQLCTDYMARKPFTP